MDFIHDNSGRYLLRIISVTEAPDYVKQASVDPEDPALQVLPPTAFADQVNREFPLDNAGHVWLGYAFCKAAGLEKPLPVLRRAGELYGITADLDALDAKLVPAIKEAAAAPQPRYAIYVDFQEADPAAELAFKKSGGVHGFYPINDAHQVATAAVKLANDKPQIPLELFAEGCRAIVKAASELKLAANSLPKLVRQYGTLCLPDPAILNQAAEMRKEATGDAAYLALARKALAASESDYSPFAEEWLALDRKHNFKAASTDGFACPFLLMHSGMSVADRDAELKNWVAIGEAVVPRAKVASAETASLTKWFGKELAGKLEGLVKAAGTATGAEVTAAFGELPVAVQKEFVRRCVLV